MIVGDVSEILDSDKYLHVFFVGKVGHCAEYTA